MSGFIKLLNRGRPALSVLAGLLLAGIWHVASTGSPTGAGMPEGRYHSAGQLQMSDGTVLEVNHSIRFNGGRFYAISRQGDILQDSSGLVERAGGALLLRVQGGEVLSLGPDTDTDLIESLLYSRHPGASIRLYRLGDCLYARASLQVYCPPRELLSLR